jgi:hypothetical protein
VLLLDESEKSAALPLIAPCDKRVGRRPVVGQTRSWMPWYERLAADLPQSKGAGPLVQAQYSAGDVARERGVVLPSP